MTKSKKTKKVFIGMSGGVDSSVAALLLKKQGYDVVGVFMRCFNIDGCAERDVEDARRVAEKLEISFYIWDFEEEYKKKVVEYMIDGYRSGITPNPDVMCNREIKFGIFLNRALELGADFIATGHYIKVKRQKAKIKNTNQESKFIYKLFQAKDKNKDQSYFLWTLTQRQLKHCIFPIGDYLKSEIREIAKNAGLPTAEKKDSQGICFLGKVTLVDFLKEYIPEKKGDVLNARGEKIGEHNGIYFYTIGQRHGLKISGSKPYYIAEKNSKSNIIKVAEGGADTLLCKKEIKLAGINLINPNFDFKNPVFTRVRYRQPLIKSFIVKNKNILLVFDKPQKFIAPGQSAVIYSKNGEMLGGGIII